MTEEVLSSSLWVRLGQAVRILKGLISYYKDYVA
jgi:hypothetical protein